MQGVKTEHGNAVYSKFPITSHSNTFFDVPYGHVNHDELLAKDDFTRIPQAFQKIEIKVNNMELTIINVHGIWGFDGEDNERRLKMSQMIVDKIKGEKNVILAGDFNVRPETETIRNIEKYLKNVFKDELKSTFNMKRKKDGGYATSVVDMIFVSPKTKADQEKMSLSLRKLSDEDPTFRIKTDPETAETIISGMGELHLEIIVDRLKREFSVG